MGCRSPYARSSRGLDPKARKQHLCDCAASPEAWLHWPPAASMDGESCRTSGTSTTRSEERRVGKEWYVRVDLGGRRILKKNKTLLHSTNFYRTHQLSSKT